MFFDRTRKPGPSLPQLHTLQGRPIELVCSYKCLGFILEENMNFNLHIKQLLTKLKLKLGFYFRNSSCFTQKARKKLVEAMFLPVLDLIEITGFCISFSIEIYNACKVLCSSLCSI